MDKLRIYLSGATKQVSKEFQNWRYKCLDFEDIGLYPNLKFIDPISYFNYTDKKPKTDKQCLDLFMWMVESCDVLLVNLDNSESSVGTMAEIEHAYCNNIPVIGFGTRTFSWYSWARERCSITFNTLDEAVDYINYAYGVLK